MDLTIKLQTFSYPNELLTKAHYGFVKRHSAFSALATICLLQLEEPVSNHREFSLRDEQLSASSTS